MEEQHDDCSGHEAPEGSTYHVTYKNSTVDNSNHIHGDNIRNVNTITYHSHRSTEGPQDRLEKYVSKGAAHDSADRGTDGPKCFPETRQAVQGGILSFVDSGGEEKILWLTGPAGAGKTAIIGSIADECHARGWLAGSFFFSISVNKVDRCSKRYLIATLAYQLFQLNIPGLPEAILASIVANPSVFDKILDQQVEILLIRPLREVLQRTDPSTWPKVVLVDGLDECAADEDRDFETEQERQRSRENNHREVLSALTRATQDPAFPFRIIIASRPESAIHEHFSSLRAGKVEKIVLDSTYNPEVDIELYLRAMFTQIGRQYRLPGDWYNQAVPLGKDGSDWSTTEVPRYLAEEASGQFIYAATVVRFLQDKSGHPQKQLQRVLNWESLDPSQPFAALDNLYAKILHTSQEPRQAALFIDFYGDEDTLFAARFWQKKAFLESFQGETEYLLEPLTSLVHLGERDGEPYFQLYHKSLLDFLESPQRSGNLSFLFNRDFISARCYEIMKTVGGQVLIPEGYTLGQFLPWFCRYFATGFLVDVEQREYNAVDVGWWLSNLDSNDNASYLPYMFGVVHYKCHWYACRPACKVWRKGILRYAKATSWRVPTTLEMLRERFGRWRHGWRGDDLLNLYSQILHEHDTRELVPSRS